MTIFANGTVQKKIVLFVLLLALLLSPLHLVRAASVDGVQVASAPMTTRSQATNGMVRVWLSSLGSPTRLDLTIRGRYSIGATGEFLSNGSSVAVQFNQNTGNITLSYNGQSVSMGKKVSLRRHSASGTNGILIQQSRESSNPYPGDLSFEAVYSGTSYRLYTIAYVYIETYLYGVLPYEMGNSSNVEALKAQAVAARTYTVRMMKSRASGRYDVQDTTSDQVYRGTPSGNANCVAAVDATRGIVLMYGSDYITTYYSSSNGGQTEISRTGSRPGYMTVKDDPFDYANTSSTVKKKTIYTDLQSSANPSQLIALLKSKTVSSLQRMGYAATSANTTLKTLKTVTPHTPMYASPSRLYTKIDFTFTVETRTSTGLIATLTHTETCDIFDELESMLSMGIQSMDNELWSVVRSSSGFVLQSRRYGHGMGMSQRGAMHMAKLGYSYDRILGFYYEGCTRVQHSFTNTILSADSSEEQVTVETPADIEQGDPNACSAAVRLAGAADVLAIRGAKASNASIVGTVQNGAIVEVKATDGSWCYIRLGELYGYVPASALVISGTPSGQEGSATSIAGFATVTANDFVNLRASGSMNASVLGTAPSGAVMTVFSVSGSWAKVQYNALTAYANTGFISAVTTTYPKNEQLSSGSGMSVVRTEDGGGVHLREAASTTSTSLTLVPYGTAVSVLSDDGSWSRVSYQGWTGYMMSMFLFADNETEIPPDDSTEEDSEMPDSFPKATVATEFGALNMRASASAGSLILTTIPRGETVSVTEHGELWSAVYYAGWSGYVMTCYLDFDDESAVPPADEPAGETQAVVTTPRGTLNLRSQPQTGSEILRVLQPGTIVTVHERGSTWCYITANGTTGYVMTMFLDFDVEVSTPDSGTEETDGIFAYVNTSNGGLNLRAAPSLYAEVLALIPQYGKVNVLSKESTWCEVGYNGWMGYVMTEYLSFDSNSTPEAPSEPDTEASAQTAYVYTTSGPLNLRDAPSSYAGLITTIPRLETVSVLSKGEEWSVVNYSGYQGYVMTRYLRFTETWEPEPDEPEAGEPDESQAVAAWVVTESGSLNLRAEPNANAALVATIPSGAQVRLLMEGNEWSYLLYQGSYGYAATRYLSVHKPANGFVPVETNGDPTLEEPEYDMRVEAFDNKSLALWPSCSLNGTPLGYVPAGEEMIVMLIGETWSCVQYGSLQGYCLTNDLSVVE